MAESRPAEVIGAGQAGLAAGYHLRRLGVDFVILDAQAVPGGAWTRGWESLRLFSPARHSSLPGRPMSPFRADDGYPTAGHVVDYLADYEKRYDLPAIRPARVRKVHPDGALLRVVSDAGEWSARFVLSATGTWWRPFVPAVAGAIGGRQLHTAGYRGPAEFAGGRVVVVGAGNSGAQIAADLIGSADVLWVTRRPPRYLPDHIDGRALFDVATRRKQALDRGEADDAGVAGLGDIVAVPPVRQARDGGLLVARPMFDRLEDTGPVWSDGTREAVDTIIWCTGFRPALSHLTPLRRRTENGHIATAGTRAVDEPRLHQGRQGLTRESPRPANESPRQATEFNIHAGRAPATDPPAAWCSRANVELSCLAGRLVCRTGRLARV